MFVACLAGFSKTGVPGSGILIAPVMAALFGGRLSVGATLPLLIVADAIAFFRYRQHAQWVHLRQLAPYITSGIVAGTLTLKVLGDRHARADVLSPVIGWIVLAMLALSLLRGRYGNRLVPTSRAGIAVTGTLAGFFTMISNAAGPLMQIYLTATGMAKDHLMGTTVIVFFVFNLVKLPFLLFLNLENPADPVISKATLLFDLKILPFVFVGAFLGTWLFPRIPQKAFRNLILVLTFLASVKLILG
ncbi:sulfite exporter TauE/SafE family protein [soil metagenome]